MHISQKLKGVIMHNLCDTIFYMKMNVLQDFHICIGLTLASELGIRQGSMLIVFDLSLIGIKTRWTNSMEELLADTSSHMFIYFSHVMLLLGNITSDIDIYSARQSII